MTVSVSNITGGPAQFLLDDERISHTQGGIKVKVSPKNRMRVVDQYGETPVDVIHQGDDVRVTAPLSEWTAAVLKNVYAPGYDQTSAGGDKYIGIGRSAGFIYGDKDLKVIPLLSADADRFAQFYRAVPVGEFELSHGNDGDRVFSVEFACLGDPENSPGTTDGQIIGKIFLDGTPPSPPTTTTSP